MTREPFATIWSHPGRAAQLVLCDAVPVASSALATLDVLWPRDGAEQRVLADDRFAYRCQLHDGAPEDLELLDQLAFTIAPFGARTGVQVITAPLVEFAGWTRRRCEGGVELVSPTNEIVRIRPRMSPCRRWKRHVDDVITERCGRMNWTASAPATSVTPEGECALIGRALLGADLECAVAMVGDEPFLSIEAFGPLDSQLPRVERLSRVLGLGLGPDRRRWIRYTPPAGWIGRRGHDATDWWHPSRAARITVSDARPFVGDDLDRLDRYLFVQASAPHHSKTEALLSDATNLHGLVGRERSVVDEHGRQTFVALADDRFLYTVVLDGDREDARTLEKVVESIEPVPRAVETAVLHAIWCD